MLPRIRHRTRRDLAREAAIGAGLGVLMALATQILAPIALRIVPSALPEIQALYGNLRHEPGPVGALPVLALAVLTEEVIWRGVTLRWLKVRARPWAAVGGAAVLYAIPQIASHSALLFALALGCGLLWGAIRVWRHSLAAPIACHFVWNLIVFVFWPIPMAVEAAPL